MLNRMWTAYLLLLYIFVNYASALAPGDLQQISPEGQVLASMLDSLRVEELWKRGQHINWFSGEPNNPNATYGVATHCSAFVSAVAERYGVPFLRPPNHGQVLLASPQHRWLEGPGQQLGWRLTTDLMELQYAANQGKLAVISKESLNASVPGHIAVVRPNKVYNVDFLLKNGPQLAQAGRFNSANITANKGFRPLFLPDRVIYAIFDPPRAPLAPLPTTLYTAPSSNSTLYAVNSGPFGNIDVIRLSYSSKGSPVWAAANGGFGVGNSSAWVPWFAYSLPCSPPTGVPMSTKKTGWSAFGLSKTSSGKQELSLLSQSSDPPGPMPPILLNPAPDKNSTDPSAQYNLTGLWFAALDGQFYGVFITKTTEIGLSGYILKYSGEPGGGSEWETLSANWTTTSDSGGISTINQRSAQGYTEKCSLATAKTVQCSQTASNVVIDIDGPNAKISGIDVDSTLNTVYTIEKATSYYNFLS